MRPSSTAGGLNAYARLKNYLINHIIVIIAISIPDNIGQHEFLSVVSLAECIVVLFNRISAYHTPFHSVRFKFLDNSPYFTQNIFSDDWISLVK